MNIIAITQKGPNKAENEDRIILGKNIIINPAAADKLLMALLPLRMVSEEITLVL